MKYAFREKEVIIQRKEEVKIQESKSCVTASRFSSPNWLYVPKCQEP